MGLEERGDLVAVESRGLGRDEPPVDAEDRRQARDDQQVAGGGPYHLGQQAVEGLAFDELGLRRGVQGLAPALAQGRRAALRSRLGLAAGGALVQLADQIIQIGVAQAFGHAY
jgi:hypothetical protein